MRIATPNSSRLTDESGARVVRAGGFQAPRPSMLSMHRNAPAATAAEACRFLFTSSRILDLLPSFSVTSNAWANGADALPSTASTPVRTSRLTRLPKALTSILRTNHRAVGLPVTASIIVTEG